MAVAWFLVPYKRRDRAIGGVLQPGRYCAMDDFTPQIQSDGGRWREAEVIGDHAIVKVRASVATLQAIDAAFYRFPASGLSTPLASLDQDQRADLRAALASLGFDGPTVTDAIDFQMAQLRDVVQLIYTRPRRKPRYDTQSDEIVLDGQAQQMQPIDDVDRGVPDG